MRLWILTVLLMFLPVLAMAADEVRIVPSSKAESRIATFILKDGSVTAADCARWDINAADSAADVSCADKATKYISASAWTVTSLDIQIYSSAWSVAEACDVDVDVNGTTVATFLVGNDGLQDLEHTGSVSISAVALAADQNIIVRHDTPANTSSAGGVRCDSGTCACVAAVGGYIVRVYGYRNQ